jgi:hypothetical protein
LNRAIALLRAENRCEYCGISQIGQVATFHIDHIVPVVAGGKTIAENLALACVSCSLRKGARQNLEDSETGEVVSIFNPRQQAWKEHFDCSSFATDSSNIHDSLALRIPRTCWHTSKLNPIDSKYSITVNATKSESE